MIRILRRLFGSIDTDSSKAAGSPGDYAGTWNDWETVEVSPRVDALVAFAEAVGVPTQDAARMTRGTGMSARGLQRLSDLLMQRDEIGTRVSGDHPQTREREWDMTPDGTGPAGETREDGEERLRRERAQAAYDREYAKAGRPWWQTDRGILAIAAAVLIVIAVIAGIGGDSGPVAEPAAPAQGDVASDVEAEPAAAPEPPPPTPEPVYYEPTKRDFRVDLKVLSKDCFGSAGCLIDVRPDLTFLGLGELDPGVTYELTFEVVGPLTDPVVKTLDITGEDYGFEEFTVDTTTDGDVDARVIGFEERRF